MFQAPEMETRREQAGGQMDVAPKLILSITRHPLNNSTLESPSYAHEAI
jgi:hypothetical protein